MKVKLNAQKDKEIKTVRSFHLKYQPTIKKPASKLTYLRQPAFLDTETSHNHDDDNPIGWIYQWCLEFAGEYCVGRKPSELIKAFRQLHDHYELNQDEKRMVIFVHNLSYDHCYIWRQLTAEFGDPKILAIKPHKILSACYDGLEFRCSYLLSNMSLSAWGEKLKCKVHKVDNGIDYDQIRYQNTRLNKQDWFYMINDVAALKNCVYSEMVENDDNIVTIPLTSTGYVRRDCRRAFRKEEGTRTWFTKTRLDVESYKANFYTYAGGLTHGNRFLAGQTIKKVDHIDFKSFYPANDQLRYMPMGKWEHVYSYLESNKPFEMDRFKRFIENKCVIMLVSFKNLYLRKYVTCPALSKSKVYNYPFVRFTINDAGTLGTDNGRVVNAIGDDVMLWLTELDYYWIVDQYKTDGLYIVELFACDRGYDTQAIRNVTNEYFKVKEGLEKDGYFYHKSKNRLNAIYGMKSTNPVRSDCELNLISGAWSEVRDMSDEHIEQALDRYYKSYNSFNNFSHGIYITSWARSLLLYVIKNIIGYPRFIYGDTDSAFYKRSRKIDRKLAFFNRQIVELNKSLGLGVPNRDGGVSYYGVLEKEKPCKKFRFLHAKCYAFVDSKNKLHCTIAGVTADNKRLKDDPLYVTREMELKDIKELHDNFTFVECGGTSSNYDCNYEPQVMTINGHDVEVASACIIKQVTKTLGGTVDGFNIYEVSEHE